MLKAKTALITGVTGQDGSYLAKFLLSKNYIVIGTDKKISSKKIWRHKYLKIDKKIVYEKLDIRDKYQVKNLLSKYDFKEVYNLAGQSRVDLSLKKKKITDQTNFFGVKNLLENIIKVNRKIKFFQCSSAEMYGKSRMGEIKTEKSKFEPLKFYGVSKLRAHKLTDQYRKRGIFCVNGILFHHESPLRKDNFVTKKIIKNLINIKLNKKKFFYIGNLNIYRDWGYAREYIKAMWKTLQHNKPDNYLICSGKVRSIKEFIEIVAKTLKMKINFIENKKKIIGIFKNKKIIIQNKKFFRADDKVYLRGSNKKIKKIGWRYNFSLKRLVKIMIDYELNISKKLN